MYAQLREPREAGENSGRQVLQSRVGHVPGESTAAHTHSKADKHGAALVFELQTAILILVNGNIVPRPRRRTRYLSIFTPMVLASILVHPTTG